MLLACALACRPAQVVDTASVVESDPSPDSAQEVDTGPAPSTCAEVDGNGATRIDPGDGDVTVWCQQGWTLGFLKNSVHEGEYGRVGAERTGEEALATQPSAASASNAPLAGWLDLNAFPFAELRMSAYHDGVSTYESDTIPRKDLRLAFGEQGYMLYEKFTGYVWCLGDAAFTDEGGPSTNPPDGAPDDCKDHHVLGSGWDFSRTDEETNAGLTVSGADASGVMSREWGGGLTSYPDPGVAHAIWVR